MGFIRRSTRTGALLWSVPYLGFIGFVRRFTLLRTAPRELWIILLAYVFENAAYKLSSAQVLPLWLAHQFGLTDTTKGFTIGTWSVLVTFFTVLVGSFTDAVGIRKTFLLGFGVCVFARMAMLFSGPPIVPLGLGLFPLAMGLALMSPVMTAAMKRYSNAGQRSVAFSLYYALMNLGFAIGDWVFDYLRQVLGEYGKWAAPLIPAELSTYRVMILWSVIFTLPGLILTWFFMRDRVEMTEEGVRIAPASEVREKCEGPLTATVRIFCDLWGQSAFYRFLLFMTLVVGVRMIFFHLSYTLPDFAIRQLGQGVPFARLCNMLNSIMILVLVPICGALTHRVAAYRMVTVGSFISALSVFFLVVPVEWFRPLADGWLGDFIAHKWLNIASESVNPLFIALFFFTVFLSIGEAFWSPRLYEYAAAIAPKGQEASYMALSVLPYFFAKFGAGSLSGWLLATYCPKEGPRDPTVMWLWVGCMALITPVGTFLFRRFIQMQEAGRDSVAPRQEGARTETERARGLSTGTPGQQNPVCAE
jgi:MFS family permease